MFFLKLKLIRLQELAVKHKLWFFLAQHKDMADTNPEDTVGLGETGCVAWYFPDYFDTYTTMPVEKKTQIDL